MLAEGESLREIILREITLKILDQNYFNINWDINKAMSVGDFTMDRYIY